MAPFLTRRSFGGNVAVQRENQLQVASTPECTSSDLDLSGRRQHVVARCALACGGESGCEKRSSTGCDTDLGGILSVWPSGGEVATLTGITFPSMASGGISQAESTGHEPEANAGPAESAHEVHECPNPLWGNARKVRR
mmetsp:Transcript_98725/g.235239  ORF Transcript_98725/g.235239 Transcript_98725/m.235239 type:complete len:139 (+) Transcript_98725:217-633(+)